jgi:hypothetical protein
VGNNLSAAEGRCQYFDRLFAEYLCGAGKNKDKVKKAIIITGVEKF